MGGAELEEVVLEEVLEGFGQRTSRTTGITTSAIPTTNALNALNVLPTGAITVRLRTLASFETLFQGVAPVANAIVVI